MNDEMTPKVFINRVLAGTATGILIGLIPNAVLVAILKLFGNNTVALTFTQIGLIFQLATPLIIGTLIASHFQLEPLKMLVVGGAAFAGSGVIKYDTQAAALVGAGTGDFGLLLFHRFISSAVGGFLFNFRYAGFRRIWLGRISRAACCSRAGVESWNNAV